MSNKPPTPDVSRYGPPQHETGSSSDDRSYHRRDDAATPSTYGEFAHYVPASSRASTGGSAEAAVVSD